MSATFHVGAFDCVCVFLDSFYDSISVKWGHTHPQPSLTLKSQYKAHQNTRIPSTHAIHNVATFLFYCWFGFFCSLSSHSHPERILLVRAMNYILLTFCLSLHISTRNTKSEHFLLSYNSTHMYKTVATKMRESLYSGPCRQLYEQNCSCTRRRVREVRTKTILFYKLDFYIVIDLAIFLSNKK